MSRPNPGALGAADAIANRLAHPPTHPPTLPRTDTATGRGRRRPQSLAGGAAGIALLHIERARAGHGDWITAHAWLSAAVREDLSAGPNASLFFGAPTLAFATHAALDRPGKLTRAIALLDASTAAVTRRRLDEAHARIDRGDRPALAEFDLICGLAGLGAYHLRRNPHHDITAELPRLTARLLTQLRAAPEDTEFLDGHAGIALALHTAGTNTAPLTHWDACLLLT